MIFNNFSMEIMIEKDYKIYLNSIKCLLWIEEFLGLQKNKMTKIIKGKKKKKKKKKILKKKLKRNKLIKILIKLKKIKIKIKKRKRINELSFLKLIF